MKSILINTPTGQYTIPLINVAEDRANNYAEKNTPEWTSEVDFVMNDDFEGIDWILNNTDWEDWKEISKKVSNMVYVFTDEFWTSSDDFKIIE